jgi:hypothetical protein
MNPIRFTDSSATGHPDWRFAIVNVAILRQTTGRDNDNASTTEEWCSVTVSAL